MTEEEVAAVVLLRADGAALLQHRDNKPGIDHPDMWVPPGGHREPNEPMEICARREFLEETTYRLGDVAFLTRFLDTHDREPLWVTVFWSRYDGTQQPICREGQALEFVPRDRATERRVPAYLVQVWDLALDAAARAIR